MNETKIVTFLSAPNMTGRIMNNAGDYFFMFHLHYSSLKTVYFIQFVGETIRVHQWIRRTIKSLHSLLYGCTAHVAAESNLQLSIMQPRKQSPMRHETNKRNGVDLAPNLSHPRR